MTRARIGRPQPQPPRLAPPAPLALATLEGPLDITRRDLLRGVGAIGIGWVLAGCDGDSEPPGAATEQETAAETRSVDDLYGTVEVPASPERVVTMDVQTLGNLLALGFPPERIVGAAFGGDREAFEHLEAFADIDIDAVEDVGSFDEPDVEAVAALRPDLVFTVAEPRDSEFGDYFADIYDALTPTGIPVFAASNGSTTVDGIVQILRDVARATGQDDEAERVEQELRAGIDDLAERVASAGAPSAVVLRRFEDGTLSNRSSVLLDALGVPGPRPTAEEFAEDVSAERLPELNADVIFVTSEPADEAATRVALEANPLWAGLDAVQDDRVVFVSSRVWNAYSIPATTLILDDIEQALLP